MGKKLKIKITSLLFFFLLTATISQSTFSKIFIYPEEEYLVKKTELFLNKYNFSVDTTSFPISYELLRNSKDRSYKDFGNLTSYISNFNENFAPEFNNKLILRAASNLLSIRDINDNWKDSNSFSYSSNFKTKSFAGKINLTKVSSSISKKNYYLDGSYLSFTTLNNIFGIGVIDRWWGPSHQSNLIISNYSRPSPGVFLNSLKGLEFDSFLSIFGKINYSIFINKLEKNRVQSGTFLLGGRVTLIPIKSLTFGISRTLMFGGGNRPDDLSMFWKAFIGDDNVDSATGEIDPSNQLAGWDMKYDFTMNDLLISPYIQIIGEDKNHGHFYISKEIAILGIELKSEKDDFLRALTIEFSNTIGDYGLLYNINYEHRHYRTGYRYRNLPIAAFTDNDSQFLSFKYLQEFNQRLLISNSLFYGKLNKDKSGKNVWGNGGNKVLGIKSKIKYKLSKNTSIESNIIIKDEELIISGVPLDKNALNVILEYNF